MTKFDSYLLEGYEQYAVTKWYGERICTFGDIYSARRFRDALKTIKDIEITNDPDKDGANKHGIYSVSFCPKTVVAYAICSAMCKAIAIDN